jgi:exodeoxyribonuclease VII large subunit
MKANPKDDRKILSVSQLTSDIKRLLESQLGSVWIRGEISNLRIPASGHAYFTLKDEKSQISSVCFRGRLQNLRFEINDGLEVFALGKISVYEPRGTYQIIVETLEPAGLGALQAAFEKLKEKLQKEGLFDPEHKKPLPFFPRNIGIVTSATGAALQDILKVLKRRNPGVGILLAPGKVQGDGASQEIAQAIYLLNQYDQAQTDPLKKLDLLIVGRGGGSLEDLWAFNEEIVARAIFSSEIPILSAVGHEIDFTISDFVADVRAPTPSAAAELAVPVLEELCESVENLFQRLIRAQIQKFKKIRVELENFEKRLIRPDRRIADFRLRLDDWCQRFTQAIAIKIKHEKDHGRHLRIHLLRCSPQKRIRDVWLAMVLILERQKKRMEKILDERRSQFENRLQSLQALSPLQVLSRGFCLAQDPKNGRVLHQSNDFHIGLDFELIFEEGRLNARVREIHSQRGDHLPSSKHPSSYSQDTQGQFWGTKECKD